MWFYEQKSSIGGRWVPVLSSIKPDITRGMRINTAEGTGAIIRKEPQEVMEDVKHLPLDKLQKLYGGNR